MTLSVGNRLVKRQATWTPDPNAPNGFAVEHGDPIVDDSEVNVEYEIIDLHTAEHDPDNGTEEVSARLRKVR